MKYFAHNFVFLLIAASAFSQVPNPSASNGSACHANADPAYCNKAFTALSTDPANTNAQTQVVDIAPTSISPLDIHSYLYTGNTTRVMMHWQPWFCNTGTTCNSHFNIGYDENQTATVTAHLAFMKSIGVDVVVPDWYGNSSAKAFNRASVDAMAAVIAGSPSSYPKMLLGMDQGAWTNSGQCPAGSGITTAQMEACIDAQLDYAAAHYFFQSWYETTGGKPIVTMFLDETNWSSVDFDAVWIHEHAHVAQGQSCGSGCTYTAQVLIVGRNSSSITRTGMDGGFAWPPAQQFNNASPGTQLQWNGAAGYLDNFYTICRANPSKVCIGMMYKGFDDSIPGSFGTGKIVAQQCGQVFKLTADKIASAGYSSSSQLYAAQVATYNDYEEGTEIETGVDNCYSVSGSIVGTALNWSTTALDATYSSSSTIDHLRSVYCAATCSVLTDSIPFAASGSTSLAGIPLGTWTVYMQAVGRPMIVNQRSSGLAFTNSSHGIEIKGTVNFGGGLVVR